MSLLFNSAEMRALKSLKSTTGKALVIILLILLLLVAAGGTAYYFLVVNRPTEENAEENGDVNNNGETDPGVTTDPNNSNNSGDETVTPIVVTYNGSGFSPETVDILVGGSVKFVNGSDKDVWVASNPHPIHTGLPGFDSGKAIGPGESYTYTFKEEGEFSYHNHLNFFQGGKVNVQ